MKTADLILEVLGLAAMVVAPLLTVALWWLQ